MTVPAINSISGAQNQQTFSDINALISAPQKYQSTPADTFVKEGGGKKKTVIGVVIGAVAAAATAALIIFNVVAKKRAPQIDTHLLKDINFSKGTATLQDGSKFSGVIEDTLKSGKKITMEYQDGKILKSVGEDFEKAFSYDSETGALKKIGTKFADGSEKVMANTTFEGKEVITGGRLVKDQRGQGVILDASLVDKSTGKAILKGDEVAIYKEDGSLDCFYNLGNNRKITKPLEDGSVLTFSEGNKATITTPSGERIWGYNNPVGDTVNIHSDRYQYMCDDLLAEGMWNEGERIWNGEKIFLREKTEKGFKLALDSAGEVVRHELSDLDEIIGDEPWQVYGREARNLAQKYFLKNLKKGEDGINGLVKIMDQGYELRRNAKKALSDVTGYRVI